jgi:anti-sigma factor ChrR (cupin superfamily)
MMNGMDPRSGNDASGSDSSGSDSPGSAPQPRDPYEGEGQTSPYGTPPRGGLAEDLQDQAEQYALGTRSEEETRALEARAVVHEELRAERDRLLRVTDELLLMPTPMAPRQDLWPRIQARIAAGAAPVVPVDPQIWKHWHGGTPATPVVSIRAQDTPWERTGVRGISARRLHADDAHKRVTMLVRMDAGTSYPAHRHADVEECFVLQGDLDTGSGHMRAGDYQRAEKDSVHPVQTTRGGCLLLLISSQSDQLV